MFKHQLSFLTPPLHSYRKASWEETEEKKKRKEKKILGSRGKGLGSRFQNITFIFLLQSIYKIYSEREGDEHLRMVLTGSP